MSRTYYLDALRIVAICAIVVLHVAGSYWYQVDIERFDWEVFNLYDCITRWGVPVFVMISGALFLDPARPQPLKKLWTKNIPRLVALILFWGALYALVFDLPDAWSPESAGAFIHDLLFGTPHLWFLFMLLGLYMIVPLLRCITANEEATRYFLVFGLVVNILIPFVTDTGSFGIGEDIYAALMIKLPVGYSFFFVLGYYLAKHDLPAKARWTVYVLGIVGLIGAVVASSWVSHASGSADAFIIQSTYPFAFAAAAIFILTRRRIQGRTLPQERLKTIYTLSSCTLGVYVIHIFVLRGLMAFGISALDFDPIISVPCLAAVTIVISFALAFMLKKIPVFGKYLV